MAPDAPFLGSVLGYLDCQAQSIGQGGYDALSAAGATGPVLLTGVLVLFVALFGFRLLFGQGPGVRDGVTAAVKVGAVLALATSWPAYRTLVYDVTLRGPADLGAAIGTSAGLPGAGGGLTAWLQSADDAYLLLAYLGTEPTQPRTVTLDAQGQPVPQAQQPQVGPTGLPIPRPDPGFDRLMLGLARIVYLVGTVASLAVVRLLAGLLLALGPVFAVFLLFDGTRGLFEGWVRGLAGAALGALAVSVTLGVELAFVEPWLLGLVAERQADLSISGVPVELFAFQLVFALALAGVLVGAGRVAFGFRLPAARSNWSIAHPAAASSSSTEVRGIVARDGERGSAAAEDRSRANVIADAVAATQRREAGSTPAAASLMQRSAPVSGARAEPASMAPVPIGQSYRRRTTGRISAGAGRRDRMR
jgi:type IV secretion system protein VirB6